MALPHLPQLGRDTDTPRAQPPPGRRPPPTSPPGPSPSAQLPQGTNELQSISKYS